jgi:hypothetical protein
MAALPHYNPWKIFSINRIGEKYFCLENPTDFEGCLFLFTVRQVLSRTKSTYDQLCDHLNNSESIDKEWDKSVDSGFQMEILKQDFLNIKRLSKLRKITEKLKIM